MNGTQQTQQKQDKNRVQLLVRTTKFMVDDEPRTKTELVFKTNHRSRKDIERVFGRMHYNTYDDYEYPFDTTILNFWKALDWKTFDYLEKKRIPTGEFRKNLVANELLSPADGYDYGVTGGIKGLTLRISDYLNAPNNQEKIVKLLPAPKGEVAGERGMEADDTALILKAIENDIRNSIKTHTRKLRTKGKEIIKEEALERKQLEVEFEDFITVTNDQESMALILGMRECLVEIKEKMDTLRRWRSQGVGDDERDYTFLWDRPDASEEEKSARPDGFTGPFDHQWVMFKTHTLLDSSADLSQMGTGKTLSCLMTIDKRIQDGEVRKGHILIVAPTTTLELAWQKQIKNFTPHLTSRIVSGSYADRMSIFLESDNERGDILLINYEAFAMDTKVRNKKGEEKVVPLSRLCALVDWDMVVLDECHKIKNPEAKRTSRIIKTFKDAKHKLVMSGTINANKLYDIHVPFVHLNNAVNFNSLHHTRNGEELTLGELNGMFKGAYFSGGGYTLFPKAGAVAELREKLEEVSVRFEKKECLTLPEKMYVKEELEMSVKQKQLYEALRDRLIANLTDIQENGGRVSVMNVLAKLTKLAEAANGWIYNNAGRAIELPWNPKLDRIKEIVGDIDLETQKVVVWSRFTHDLHLIAEALREEHGDEAVVVIHGGGACSCGSNSDLRADHVNQFLDMSKGNKVKIVIANQATGSHGIDLTSASYEIFYSNSFSKTDRLQAEDRCHRVGMRDSLTVIDLVCKGTVDEQVMQALMTHKAMTTALLEALGLDLTTDEEVSNEPPVINIQQQGADECLLASCAMIAGKTIEEARVASKESGIGTWCGTYLNMEKLFNYWGVKMSQVWDMQGTTKKGIAIVKWADSTVGHAVAFHSGQVYDPSYDKPKLLRRWLSDVMEKGGKFTKIMVVDGLID